MESKFYLNMVVTNFMDSNPRNDERPTSTSMYILYGAMIHLGHVACTTVMELQVNLTTKYTLLHIMWPIYQ